MATSEKSSTSEDKSTNKDDGLNPVDAQGLTTVNTTVDSNDVERIVSYVETGWTPAPTESTKEEKEAAEKRNKAFDEASKKRQEKV